MFGRLKAKQQIAIILQWQHVGLVGDMLSKKILEVAPSFYRPNDIARTVRCRIPRGVAVDLMNHKPPSSGPQDPGKRCLPLPQS